MELMILPPCMINLPGTGTIIKSPARIRLEREMVGLELPENIKLLKLDFNEMILMVRLFPDEGPFEGTAVDFEIKVPEMYPHRPPKAKILQKLFHPNFDLEGHVCLNILRLDWSPVLPITAIFFGLLSILLEPEGEEPLNQDAGNMILKDRREYNRIAGMCAKGGVHGAFEYDNIMTINT